MRNIVAMLLAGGAGSRLNILAKKRAKPAVPFGGIYRIIDFTLSNIMHSGIANVGILTQYKPLSLMDHVGLGAPWDMMGRSRSAKILPPRTGEEDFDWYQGTADAVFQNIDFIEHWDPEMVLILSGDHIYHMDYSKMIEFHQEHEADMTIAMMRVPMDEASRFGIAIVDDEYRIIGWQEKPKEPKSDLASMGIYVFNKDILIQRLCQKLGTDFGMNINPVMVRENRVFAYPFDGYWRDVGTLKSYWDANMDILDPDSGIRLDQWEVRTNLEEPGRADRLPARVKSSAKVVNSMVSSGCVIAGEVRDSVLSPGVIIEPSSKVTRSVIMHDAYIGPHASVQDAIIDKDVRIGAGAQICTGNASGEELKSNQEVQPNLKFPTHLSEGLTVIGKHAIIPSGCRIGRNCIIYADVSEYDFKTLNVQDGSTIQPS